MAQDVWLWGSDILVQNSRDTIVEGNLVVNGAFGNAIGVIQQDRGNGTFGPRVARNVSVLDNDVVFTAGSPSGTGAVADFEAADVFRPGANTFDRNRYYVLTEAPRAAAGAPSDETAQHWLWNGSRHGFAGWQAAGLDAHGSVSSVLRPGMGIPWVCMMV